MQNKMIYPGFHKDSHGMTTLSRVVLDAWLFGILPETEDCAGWDLQRMQKVMGEVEQEWDKYGSLPSFLPPELRQRHTELYEMAAERAKSLGWNPELGDDE